MMKLRRSRHNAANRSGRRTRLRLPPLSLAFWQLRQTWQLLLVIGLGLVAAVVVVCAVPLYSQIAETARLQSTFNAGAADNSYVVVQGSAGQVSSQHIQNMQNKITADFQERLGGYVKAGVQFSIELDNLDVVARQQQMKGHVSYHLTPNYLNLVGETPSQARAHLSLLKGHLPQDNPNALEIALSPATAQVLGLKPGSLIAVPILFVTPAKKVVTTRLDLLVAGIFQPNADAFWHKQTFSCSSLSRTSSVCNAFVANDSFSSALDRLEAIPLIKNDNFQTPIQLIWDYQLNIARFTVGAIPTLQQDLFNVVGDASIFSDPPFVVGTAVNDPASDVLGQFTDRAAVVQIPVVSLSLLTVGLTLFFVITMTDVLVDRQEDAIAVLRSRGASRFQVFGALLTQNAGICMAAFIVGPLVAILVVPLFSLAALPHADIGAVTAVSGDPWDALPVIFVPTLVTIAVALLAVAIAIGSAVQRNILSLRHEAARSTYRPLWQRLHADVFAGVIALVGFAFTIYATTPGVLDERVRVLVLPPLTLTGVIFLLLGLSLLLLRAFPLILRASTRLAQHQRGALPMLAAAQMARASRQPLRMTLLLAFAIAFAIFALIFNASQSQRIVDAVNYEVNADFSGVASPGVSDAAAYNHIPGVLSTTIGYTGFPQASVSSVTTSVQLLAIDAETFSKTSTWTSQDSGQPIAPLLRQLAARRQAAITSGYLPVIVDVAAWNTLHLYRGAIFSLFGDSGEVDCSVLAEVQRLPTIDDSALATGTNDASVAGGVLVDYQSYMGYLNSYNAPAPISATVWLKTRGDAASLATVRAALSSGPLALTNLTDRRAIIDNLNSDPLYLDLTGLLELGTVIAILLALVGNLVVAWLTVRARLTSFAVLRALGTTPKQLTAILSWEQSIVYATGLMLGVVFGVLLSALALPSLIFTNIAVSGFSSDISSAQYYILQSVPPVRVIIPSTLWFVFAAIVAICLMTLGIMARFSTRPALSQTLRLNED